jgi:hypothetical protein
MMYDLRFSQQWLGSVLLFGIQRHVARWKSTDVSEEYIVSILRAEEYSKQETRVKVGGKQAQLTICFHSGFLLGLFFDPEDGGHPSNHRVAYNGLHGVISQKIVLLYY